MAKVLILGGGDSPEREISLQSAQAVRIALEAAGYEVATYDPVDGVDRMLEVAHHCDVVFPVLHGKGGEDGGLQQILESAHILHVGTDAMSSKLCFNKVRFREFMQESDVAVAKGQVVNKSFLDNIPKTPYVLKP